MRADEGFWDRCDPEFCHITEGRRISRKEIIGRWRREYLWRYNWSALSLADMGCGGGWLGHELKGIVGGYTGIDISQRSLDAAKELCGYGTYLKAPVDLKTIKADVLVCQAVLFHVSPEEYASLLQAMNDSGIRYLVLQWRKSDHLKFNPETIQFACHTTYGDISAKLHDYDLHWLNEPGFNDSRYGGWQLCGT